ncbi:trehalose-phosphatase [Pseudogemmobacter humi]|uniref:Trehalose 6-phosphate phosphatase n=1 Tax=Pseudogemmobacter humi TaxID=2483812 RepID=A0A3P5XAI6_9RHOB|nr:trehalose-phosphatase [Pseudogemmobacter humi]VDC31639.1 Trehalose-6-phosphate phosphatase [Pseudogemmobacter humi]
MPPLSRWALFLDLDGTLLDLCETPDAVRPAEGLAGTLAALQRITLGALALVTGRTVAFADGLFPDHSFTIAGLHGAELRPAPGLAPGLGLPPDPAPPASPDFRAAREMARALAPALPGVIFEDKGRAFALHYRLAPAAQDEVARIMQTAAQRAGQGWRLRAGKCVVELCPSGQDKGSAVRNLMRFQPFSDRTPVAAGDDLTDEAMFRAVNALGGLSLRVGPEEGLRDSAALAGIASPGAFRSWLESLTQGLT